MTAPLRVLALLLVAVLGMAAVADAARNGPKRAMRSFTYALPGEGVFPEGVAHDARSDRFYVTSTADGTIFRGDVDKRRRTAKVFLPGGADGRTTAVGIKVARGKLYVAGGATGFIWVYDVKTRELIRRFETGTGGFINDLAVTRGGDVYATDSQRPNLFVIRRGDVESGQGDSIPLPPFLTLDASAGYEGSGFKWNGIVASRDGDTLLAVHSSRGELYRVDLDTSTVSKVDTTGIELTNGDGLVLDGNRELIVVRNAIERVAELRLSRDWTAATFKRDFTDATFMYPTTAALARGNRLLVVNSQFDARNAGSEGVTPFTVSNVKRP